MLKKVTALNGRVQEIAEIGNALQEENREQYIPAIASVTSSIKELISEIKVFDLVRFLTFLGKCWTDDKCDRRAP